jgi:hypothetical protein
MSTDVHRATTEAVSMTETLSDGPVYEPPWIEAVLAPEDIEREAMYAGPAVSFPQ